MTDRRVRTADRAAPLGEWLAAWGEPARSVAEGRVFVAGRRAADTEHPVRAGDRVSIAEPRALHAARMVARRAGVLVAYKAAGTPCEPDRRGSAGSLVAQIAAQIGTLPARIHVVTRLDLGVSGLVLLTADDEARTLVANWEGAGLVRKTYVAIAPSVPLPAEGRWDAPVRGPRGVQTAVTRYRTLGAARSGAALLELQPLTGRFHQLRAHAAQAKIPLYGDRASGGASRVTASDGGVHAVQRIALHAARLELGSPGWIVGAPARDELGALWAQLGGDLALLPAADPDDGAT